MTTKVKKVCPKCKDTGWYQYDHNHSKVCEYCCTHSGEPWKSPQDNKYYCKAGCGTEISLPHTPKRPVSKSK